MQSKLDLISCLGSLGQTNAEDAILALMNF